MLKSEGVQCSVIAVKSICSGVLAAFWLQHTPFFQIFRGRVFGASLVFSSTAVYVDARYNTLDLYSLVLWY